MKLDGLYSDLTIKNDKKLALLVMDGIGDIAIRNQGYMTPLEAATTPNLDLWASRRAVTFDRVVAASPWTIPSHVSIFSGLDALRHGVNHPTPIPGRLKMLAELFRDAGYGTLAISGGGELRVGILARVPHPIGYGGCLYLVGQEHIDLAQHVDDTRSPLS